MDGIYMCPHVPEDECTCRKPQPGLLLQAAKELSLDLSASWMIGDAWSDLLAGQAAGVRGIITGENGSRRKVNCYCHIPKILKNHFVCDDLSEAYKMILDFDQSLTHQ